MRTKLEDFLNEKIDHNVEKSIIDIVENNTSFYHDDTTVDRLNPDEWTISFGTRQNGNVGDEEYSQIDYDEGVEIGKELLGKFDNIDIYLTTVDEWVHITIYPIGFKRNSFYGYVDPNGRKIQKN